MTVRSTISLQDDVYKKAKDKADRYFGKNLSAYITNLICRDEEIVAKEMKKDSELLSAMDDILNL